jgi:histidine ammonia-lyase
MAPLSGRRLDEVVSLAWRLVALELTVAAQAVDLRRLRPLGRATSALHAVVRSHVCELGGTSFPTDLKPLVDAVAGGDLSVLLERS